MRVAVIPARGGSKRIPRKNIKEFCGRPILAYSIEAALASGLFDKVIVSTDDQEIAEVAKRLGAAIPFIRPAEVADDFATILDVLRHTVDWYRSYRQDEVESLCLIYATAPFVRAVDLQRGLEKLEATPECGSSMSVAKFTYPIQRALRVTPAGALDMISKEYVTTRSQDLEEAYMDAAQFIWSTPGAIDKCKTSLLDAGIAPVEVPIYYVQDIDTMEDWERAELLFQANLLRLEK